MNCKQAQKKIILFLDDELPDSQRTLIQEHLKGCDSCSGFKASISSVWNSISEIEHVVPSQKLWFKIASEINCYEKKKHLISGYPKSILRYAVSLSKAVLLGIGIFAGIYLGSFPAGPSNKMVNDIKPGNLQDTFMKPHHLTIFEDIPSDSPGGAYVYLIEGRIK